MLSFFFNGVRLLFDVKFINKEIKVEGRALYPNFRKFGVIDLDVKILFNTNRIDWTAHAA